MTQTDKRRGTKRFRYRINGDDSNIGDLKTMKAFKFRYSKKLTEAEKITVEQMWSIKLFNGGHTFIKEKLK